MRSVESENLYQPPTTANGDVPKIWATALLSLGWSWVLLIIRHSLVALVANGCEMTRQFKAWRFREELVLAAGRPATE